MSIVKPNEASPKTPQSPIKTAKTATHSAQPLFEKLIHHPNTDSTSSLPNPFAVVQTSGNIEESHPLIENTSSYAQIDLSLTPAYSPKLPIITLTTSSVPETAFPSRRRLCRLRDSNTSPSKIISRTNDLLAIGAVTSTDIKQETPFIDVTMPSTLQPSSSNAIFMDTPLPNRKRTSPRRSPSLLENLSTTITRTKRPCSITDALVKVVDQSHVSRTPLAVLTNYHSNAPQDAIIPLKAMMETSVGRSMTSEAQALLRGTFNTIKENHVHQTLYANNNNNNNNNTNTVTAAGDKNMAYLNELNAQEEVEWMLQTPRLTRHSLRELRGG